MANGFVEKVFSGVINNGETRTYTVYTLPGWTSTLLEIVVLIHDANSDTNRRFFSASYGCYRQWDTPPTIDTLATDFDKSAGQAKYDIKVQANGNDIQVVLAQSGFSTYTVYSVVAKYLFAKTSQEEGQHLQESKE